MTEPRPNEFRRFHDLLVEHAPDGYTPWYFRAREGSKAPATKFGSWKEESARLDVDEAVAWMEEGGNVGIAGTGDDALVNVDIDDEDETTPDDLKETLIARSRSRTGVHAWYFAAQDEEIPNIPTEDAGEVRANWQYVVAPGSYVDTKPDDVPEEHREEAGYYTIEREAPVTSLRFDELPQVFREHQQETEQENTDAELQYELPEEQDDEEDGGDGRGSALFDINAEDVVRKEGGSTDTDDRWSAIFHGSDTDANMSVSSQGLIQCWRHGVTHNGFQALVVLSDYSGGCEQVGSAHKASTAGSSSISNEDGAHVWEAWKYAKQNGYIPDGDPVPYSAIRHLCRSRDLCAVSEIPDDPDDGSIPAHAYDAALMTIEENDKLDPGRVPTDEIDDSGTVSEKPDTDDIDSSESDVTNDSDPWSYVCGLYQSDQDNTKLQGRQKAADALESETSFMYVLESEILWVYDPERGYHLPKGESYIQSVLEENLGSYYSISEKNEITDRIRARSQVKREELNARDADDPLLCVGNGVVNFRTGELLDHSGQYNFTRGLEWDYDPDNAERGPVVEFLESITRREEDWRTIVDHLAHGLMPGHPYRAFVMMYGPGGNGKTQLGELLRGFVGGENAAAVELQDLTGDDEFASGALPSAFVNIGDDVSVGEIRNTSVLKTVTGGGTLRANEKHEKRYDFKNEAAMFFSANEPPRIAEDKQSIDDRLYPIEMPYRFVDNPDPENDFEREKVPGISDKLLDNEAAMEGLLALAVEQGQRLIETNGQYAMPEGPAGRRERYEAASDPILRFVVDHLEDSTVDDMVLKGDAYSVYTTMCDRDDERPASEDAFKRKLSQQTTVDVENAQTRQLTAGDSRDRCWKYVRFTDAAKSLMSTRLSERYFPGNEQADVEETAEDDAADDHEAEFDASDDPDDERAAFGAEPIISAAESLTGYVTVTAEIVTTVRLGETNSGCKAVLKDASGAMDLVSWDAAVSERLEGFEGEAVAVRNAEVSEYDGDHQLSVVDGLTSIEPIQYGVGFTEAPAFDEEATEDGTAQGGLNETSSSESSTDSSEYEGAKARVVEYLQNKEDTATVPELAGSLNTEPSTVRDAVDKLQTDGDVIERGSGIALND